LQLHDTNIINFGSVLIQIFVLCMMQEISPLHCKTNIKVVWLSLIAPPPTRKTASSLRQMVVVQSDQQWKERRVHADSFVFPLQKPEGDHKEVGRQRELPFRTFMAKREHLRD
jgi:hypothetical protein